MSTATMPPSMPPAEPLWPLTVDQFHEMIRTGILGEDDPVELLDGYLVQTMPKNPLHSYLTEALREVLAPMLPEGFFAQSQEPVTLPTSEPEPDVTAVRGKRIQFIKRHPAANDIALLVEVSDKSLRRDRDSKKRIYARAGINPYRIVNLVDRQIEVYSQPSVDSGDYVERTVYAATDAVPVVIDGVTVGTIRLADLLPPE
jgi:Uma2 family endonuclease